MWENKFGPHLYRKRGIYYFARRIPEDLKGHYKRDKIVLSLRTKSLKAARTRASTLAGKLDQDWLALRWKNESDPFNRFLLDHTVEAKLSSSAPTMTEAKELYVRAKREGRSITFQQAADRAVRELASLSGDKPIDTYTRTEANALRDMFLKRGLRPSSIKRTFNIIRAIVNFTTRELGLDEVRTFSAIYLGDREAEGEKKRKAIPIDVIRSVQAECRTLNDEARWLIALISNSGMRLSEAAGLVKSDLVLDSDHPHIVLKPHSWRSLKTSSSSRIVPLVGEALWAAKRAYEASTSEFLFPKYCDHDQCKANSASAALNKWLRPRAPKGCVIHSFRHSIRDRLRAVECPPDIIDRLGGWTVGGVGESYGNGYPNEVLHRWMTAVASAFAANVCF